MNFICALNVKCANNSAIKYIKNFGKIIRICLASGWLDKDPFVNYKAKVKRVDRIFLNREELQAIADKLFPTERLNQVRDIFLFCCFTGLAYADVKKLKPAEIVKGLDGENVDIYQAKKNGHAKPYSFITICIEFAKQIC